MSDESVMHLGVTAADLGGATLAIVQGNPARVTRIAETMDEPVHLTSNRKFTT